MVGMDELSLIVKRLEIVTEKLEAIGEGAGVGFVVGAGVTCTLPAVICARHMNDNPNMSIL